MVNIPRRIRRRLMDLGILALIVLAVIYIFLPPDSPIRLALRFNASRASNAVLDAAHDRDAWLRKPPQYDIDLPNEVGYLVKTGYGTRHRVPLQVKALKDDAGILGEEDKSFIVVGDWTTVNETDAEVIGVPVHDALRIVRDVGVDKKLRQHKRLQKYGLLEMAIKEEDEDAALSLGKSVGWELDALKFIAGMELMYQKMPDKKWYMILDDDTYLVKSNLELLLSHLDSNRPYYIGNAVGDYRGRFGHGGSAILLSAEAMRRLFKRKDIVKKAYRNSLDETWGDKLVATTLQKVGIYLEERYSHHFNGEPPELTRITADKFCSPILSFHSLRKPTAMADLSQAIGRKVSPVLWGELLDILGTTTSTTTTAAAGDPEAGQRGADHVGPLDEERSKTWKDVRDAAECRAKCSGRPRWCLAWTYDGETKLCHTSPWVVPGADDAGDKVSGVNQAMIEKLGRRCF